jgi:formate dehydrogenase major subunit
MILWGMGVSQHIHGTDNARCLIALCMMTGQIGRPGCGLHPLRGQNNVQRASDSGLIPIVFPDYRRVDNAEGRALRRQLGDGLDRGGLSVFAFLCAAQDCPSARPMRPGESASGSWKPSRRMPRELMHIKGRHPLFVAR